tara:strand:+ start:2106 stop:2354 length:249 start_codon:yes stop_codon:yes gene_type:complete
MKEKKKIDRAQITEIVKEIAHDLNLDKKLVKEVLLITFKEIALILIFKKSPIMIRRFVKIVLAIKGIKRIKENLNNLKTKQK